mmetsp:Transcript_4143/g.15202  ORF Transcript_4143/g.15202 Transcript_4143/m.15202 type:complete len:242 (+) Transcript_4143:2832-3557(+)
MNLLIFSIIVGSGGAPVPSNGTSNNRTSSNGFNVPAAARICSSVIFLESSRSRYPYSTFPKQGAFISAGYILNPAFFMSLSAFHISGTIIQSCFTAIGPSGNHWFGPFARTKHSYTFPPSSTMASYFADALNSCSVGGRSAFFSPLVGLRRLGFCNGAAVAVDFFAVFSAFFAAFFASLFFKEPTSGAGAEMNGSSEARVTTRRAPGKNDARRGTTTGRDAMGASAANMVRTRWWCAAMCR